MTFIPKNLSLLDRTRVQANRWYRAAARRIHRASRLGKPPGRPIFVVGSGRSGTDLLVHCLAQSPRVTLVNEDHPRVFNNWRLIGLEAVSDALRWSRTDVTIFKPIVETPRTVELLDKFPDSCALFIFRNPREAIVSLWKFFGDRHIKTVQGWIDEDFALFPNLSQQMRQHLAAIWQQNQSAETACAVYWLVYNSTYFDLRLDENPRVRLLHYERLVNMPSKTLRSACEFTGIPFRSAMTWQVHTGTSSRAPELDIPDLLEAQCLSTWDRLRTAENLSA